MGSGPEIFSEPVDAWFWLVAQLTVYSHPGRIKGIIVCIQVRCAMLAGIARSQEL